jgi:hypothetical protein
VRIAVLRVCASSRGVAEYELGLVGFALGIVGPAGEERASCFLAAFDGDDGAVLVVGVQRVGGFGGGECGGSLALPLGSLTAHFGERRHTVGGREAAEGGAGFDGLELLGVADQDDFGVGFLGDRENAFQLLRAEHAGLVDDEDVTAAQGVAAALPGELVAREGARVDTGGGLEVLGGNAGERCALDGVAVLFPDLAHGGKRGALAGTGAGRSPG